MATASTLDHWPATAASVLRRPTGVAAAYFVLPASHVRQQQIVPSLQKDPDHFRRRNRLWSRAEEPDIDGEFLCDVVPPIEELSIHPLSTRNF